jgi:chromosome segregation ATPase
MGKSNHSATTEIQSLSSPSSLENSGLKTNAPEPTADELGRLRDILFGSQSRTLEKRLDDLETDLRSLRQELTELLQDQIGAFSKSTNAQFVETRREFNGKLDKQNTDQSTQLLFVQKDLTERLDKQSVEQVSQLQIAQKQLNDKLENLAADMLRQKSETQELLSTVASLDSKKASRQDLGQMLMELGLRLQQGSENS